MEVSQHSKYFCEFCSKYAVKRKAVGFGGARSVAKSKQNGIAVMMLDELVSVGVVPNTVTYNTMMNGVCNDILDRAMILIAKLLKMAFVPNIVTTNFLLSHLCKQGLPERTLMGAEVD
ncbi:hypothetical protein U1Q18_022991 [Sarracenia purpurea var. burkii]